MFCADFESAHESETRGGPRAQKRKLSGSNPQSANSQSAQSFAIGAREARKCKIASGVRNWNCA
eukprot:14744226-Alexandrium_andersonii.AAC.1